MRELQQLAADSGPLCAQHSLGQYMMPNLGRVLIQKMLHRKYDNHAGSCIWRTPGSGR